MKLARLLLLLVVLIFAFTGFKLQSAQTGVNLPVETRSGLVTVGLGLQTASSNFTIQQNLATTVYTIDDYKVQITETATKEQSILRVQIDRGFGLSFNLNSVSFKLQVPGTFAGIWYPGSDVNSATMMSADAQHTFATMSDANFGIPFVGAVTSEGKNALAIGMGHQDLSIVLSGQPQDSSYAFEVKRTTPFWGAAFDESFYISRDGSVNWFDAASNYADWVDAYTNYKQFPISTQSYRPLYDTWYWSVDQVNSDLYLKTAQLSSQVGAGIFLADSGWDAPPGEWNKWLAGETGNYSPPPDEFPNLVDTFQTIRNTDGMAIQLWLQPFAVGRLSTRYPETASSHIQIPLNFNSVLAFSGATATPYTLPLGANLETVNLCPRVSDTASYLKNLFAEMAQRYNPEGYWLDFIDGLATYCIAGHHHDFDSFGEGFRQSLEAIKSTVLAFNPNAVVQFRARYANLNTKSYANTWQSEDSPDSYDQMRLNALRLRPFSKGVVFKADELYWPQGIPDSEIGKFIMTSVMTGVPAFGSNLLLSSESELTMLRAWLQFYNSHQDDLANGRFVPFGDSIQMPNHKIEGSNGTYVYVRNVDSSDIVAGNGTVYLMNATNGTNLGVRVQVPVGPVAYEAMILDRYLVAQPGPLQLPVNLNHTVTLPGGVDEGGIVVLTPVQFEVSPIGIRNKAGKTTIGRPLP